MDAFITAGSTGAAMSGALFNVGRIKGIHRPALAPLLPTLKGHAILIDCGANADCKADYLVPVSYTHLDVYKRQVQHSRFHCRGAVCG